MGLVPAAHLFPCKGVPTGRDGPSGEALRKTESLWIMALRIQVNVKMVNVMVMLMVMLKVMVFRSDSQKSRPFPSRIIFSVDADQFGDGSRMSGCGYS